MYRGVAVPPNLKEAVLVLWALSLGAIQMPSWEGISNMNEASGQTQV